MGRKRKDESVDGVWVRGKKRMEGREVLWGDDDGDSEGFEG